MQSKHSQIYGTKLGSPTMMQVRFREVEPTNLWLWFEMVQSPSDKERQMLQEVPTHHTRWMYLVLFSFLIMGLHVVENNSNGKKEKKSNVRVGC